MAYMRVVVKKPCATCGAEFAGRANRLYCSDACRPWLSRTRIEREARLCGGCGESFVPRHVDHRACSGRCWARVKRGIEPSRVCAGCGAAFPTSSNHIRCEPCREASALVRVVIWRPLAKHLQWWTKPGRYRVVFTPGCVRCQMPLSRVSWRRNSLGLCWTCSHEKTSKRKIRIKRRTRERVMERARGRCEDCGSVAAESLLPFEVHHVVPVSMGGRPHALSNLRFLCWDCHQGSGWERNHAELVA